MDCKDLQNATAWETNYKVLLFSDGTHYHTVLRENNRPVRSVRGPTAKIMNVQSKVAELSLKITKLCHQAARRDKVSPAAKAVQFPNHCALSGNNNHNNNCNW
jgi:hypothetical protein|uniref:Uncharacterized protein n=1 Tax=Eutreptiella gymnastica TaxID=73025 RepID=A0A6T2AF05_9EUGL|mmetsp:Transcript_69142/g.115353  ORF Transcript_69142/g.115353 Transcript_69142/m.115353 type:complete len:103 (-) Transcript_69142:630-938(-)